MTTLSPQPTPTPTPTPPAQQPQTNLKTHHCRFCNHLLLATTRELASLPRRREPGRDGAVILPLPGRDNNDEIDNDNDNDDDNDNGNNKYADEELEEEKQEKQEQGQTTKRTQTPAQTQTRTKPQPRPNGEYSILLSTTLPDRRAMLVRREDGFEKRTMLRCGRCRVVVGYFLDGVHFGTGAGAATATATGTVYLLPGALMETGTMGDEETKKGLDREWSAW